MEPSKTQQVGSPAVASNASARLSGRYRRKLEVPRAVSAESLPQSSVRASFKARFSEMVLINFEVAPRVLKKILPHGLEADLYHGAAHLCLVVKKVQRLRKFGVPVSPPFGSLSLQLYVKEATPAGDRFGTLRLKHYVQGALPAWVLGKLTQGEISVLPMKLSAKKQPRDRPPVLEYKWKIGDAWNHIRVRGRSRVKNLQSEKMAYVLRHVDRYVHSGRQVYRSEIETPQWVIWDVAQAKFDCDVKQLFGQEFVKPMSGRPASVFVSRGKEVSISKPIPVIPGVREIML